MLRTTALELVVSFTAVVALIYLLDPLARRIGLMDHPGGRKDHAAPTPVTGGLAIALGTILPAILFSHLTPQLAGLGVAAVILIVTGVIDDLFDIPWPIRILAQVGAGLSIALIGGVQVEQIGPVFGLAPTALGALSVPFTVLATVGLINALNMVDGLDGLAGSLALCALVMLIAASIYAGNSDLANGLTLLAGAVAGFLAFNLRLPWRPRARVFLGNSGSAYLGLLIAWSSFRLTQNPGHPVTPVLAPFLIAPPVIDCLVLIVRRVAQGRSPFAADRTHAHHLMLEGGFTPTGVVLTLSGVTLVLGLAAGVARLVHTPVPALLIAYLALVTGWYVFSADAGRATRVFAAIQRLVSGRPAAARALQPSDPSEG